MASLTDTVSSVQRAATDTVAGPQSNSPNTREQYAQRYGVDIDTPGQADRLQRLEQSNTLETVQRWADEGIPIDAMGTPSKLQAFRQRKGTPVPWNVEQQNEASKRRNTSAVQRATRESPDGQTQVPDSVRDVVSTPGQPVDAALRKPVESEIGQSLDHARVHRSPAADAACDQLNARAFTVDNHVAVRSDQPSPDTPAGQHLMSHELTHVAQQTGGAVSLLPDTGALEVDPDPQLEREAEETAQRVMQGGELGIQRLQDTDVHVQRMQPGGGPSRNLQPGEGSSRDMQPGGGPSSQQNIQANQENGSARRQRVRELLENYGIGNIYWTQGSLVAADALLRNQRLRSELQSLGISIVRPSQQKVDEERTERRRWRKAVLEYCGIGDISRTRGEEAALRAVHQNPKLLGILRHLGLRIDPPNQGNVAAPPNQGNVAAPPNQRVVDLLKNSGVLDVFRTLGFKPARRALLHNRTLVAELQNEGIEISPSSQQEVEDLNHMDYMESYEHAEISYDEIWQLRNEMLGHTNPPGQQNIQPNQGNVAAPTNQGNVAANEDHGAWAQMLLNAAAVVENAADEEYDAEWAAQAAVAERIAESSKRRRRE